MKTSTTSLSIILLFALTASSRGQTNGLSGDIWPSTNATRGQIVTNSLWADIVNEVVTNPVTGAAVWTNTRYRYIVSTWKNDGLAGYSGCTNPVTMIMDSHARLPFELQQWTFDRALYLDSATNSYIYAAFYRDQRGALVNFKEWVKDNCARFYNTNYATAGTFDGLGFVDYKDEDNPTDEYLPTFRDPTNFMDRVGAPTNWLDYTSDRALNGRGGRYPRVYTQSWHFAYLPYEPFTATVSTIWLDLITVVATNGMDHFEVVTNENILPGFDSSDYTYRHADDIMRALTWVVPRFNTIKSNTWLGSVSSPIDFSTAELLASATYGEGGIGGIITTYSYLEASGAPPTYSATVKNESRHREVLSDGLYGAVMQLQPLSVDIDYYHRAVGLDEFDGFGLITATNVWTLYDSQAVTSTSTVWQSDWWGDATEPTTWPAEPAVGDPGVYRGWDITVFNEVIKPNWRWK